MIERSRYLSALRDGVADQTKLRAREGIVSYEEGPHGVTVTTDKGNRIEGSILVGADGIHSAIRAMMHPKVDTTKRASDPGLNFLPLKAQKDGDRSANTMPPYRVRDDFPSSDRNII